MSDSEPSPGNRQETGARNPNPIPNAELGQFKPGQSGNPNGRPKKSLFTQHIEAALNDPAKAKALADQVIANIMAGDSSALKQAWDRTDGPVTQVVETKDTTWTDEQCMAGLTTVLERIAADKAAKLAEKAE